MTLFKTTIAASKVLTAMYERSVFSYRGSNLRNRLNHECANWATQRRAVNDESFSINFFSSPGQYFDAETGLHYNWNRFYDPETGRYISADSIGLGGGMNLYAYVGGDPVNWVDIFGLYCCNSDESVNTNEEC